MIALFFVSTPRARLLSACLKECFSVQGVQYVSEVCTAMRFISLLWTRDSACCVCDVAKLGRVCVMQRDLLSMGACLLYYSL